MSDQYDDRADVDRSTKPVSREHYDRVGAMMRGSAILIAGSSILFGFLLNIRLTSVKSPSFIDGIILLISIYSATIAISLFIIPVVFFQRHYEVFDIEKFLSKSKKYLLGDVTLLMFTMYLTLVLSLHSELPDYVTFSLAAPPFIFIAIAWSRSKS